MSLIPAGFTRLDNETDLTVLLTLPNALAQPYLFLLNRAGPQPDPRAPTCPQRARSSHSTGGLWMAVRGQSEQKPTELPLGPVTDAP